MDQNPFPPPRNIVTRFFHTFITVMDTPVTFFREKIVEPNQQKYPWYHQKFRRVPTIDECYTDDKVCAFEANFQYQRDQLVEAEILSILKNRYEHCVQYDLPEREKCEPLLQYLRDAEAAWFCKHGDLGANPRVEIAFLKQKHRMVWERRHGTVGSGMKD